MKGSVTNRLNGKTSKKIANFDVYLLVRTNKWRDTWLIDWFLPRLFDVIIVEQSIQISVFH